MREIDASVIMPALNAAETIADQIEALAQQDFCGVWELVIVDNGSNDETVRIASQFVSSIPRMRIFVCLAPGTSAARNFGARHASGSVFLFCDADDSVDRSWISEMVSALNSADAVGGSIENEWLNPGRPKHLARHPDYLPVVAGFLPRAITANFGVRREVFEALGGFNDEYDYGAPDTEFCWRLQLAGYRLRYARCAMVHYRHRDSLRATSVKAYRTGQARARIYRDFRSFGMRRPRVIGALVRALRIAMVTICTAFSPRARWWWAEEAPAAFGRIVGSVKYKVLYL